ncbi:alpha/beta hydrolase family esterase [Caenimonas aquaedulcis]|uniref:Prolyl oligopeptidase family serine peptidase n=1 Tax=Caenimonas aquaedulcis TaxID=2793270 RepID=A0A931H150_9BURK|nr:PHB depolymerase family esterase [Caenimonas aquaedulcis]MBG9386651.1 prolyl oligopeptidase family serine peptidase [Caenimonas aquaedulcis]
MKSNLPLSVAVAAALLAAPIAQAATPTQATAGKHVTAKKKVKTSRAKVPPKQVAAAQTPQLKLPQQTISAARPSPGLDEWLTAGDHRFTIQQDGLTRSYRVHVPPRYRPTETTPLLVALNSYRGAQPTDDGFDSLLRASDYQGFIAVYPDAYGPRGKPAAWNMGNGPGNDVAFIAKVVHNVFRQTSVDRGRIYAAGVSDGGTMAYRLACQLPDVFRGVASVGGMDTSTNCAEGKAVSVFHLHAQNDPKVPFSTAPLTTAKWAQLNGCELAPRKVLQQSGAYCEAYTYCRSRTAVELCATQTGGHSWPGANAKAGAGDVPSQAIDGTASMWAFLRTH